MNGHDLLPSWTEGAAKSAVLGFTESVTRPGGSYVPPPERIAAFDNDGTLWCEKPQYVQADFLVRRWKQMVSAAVVQYRGGELYRAGGVEQPIDDGTGKPEHIWMRTGRTPLLAAGNADGDVSMLTTARFSILIRHDDAEREFAYDTGAEQALAGAKEHGWTVVSMRDDFKAVFGP